MNDRKCCGTCKLLEWGINCMRPKKNGNPLLQARKYRSGENCKYYEPKEAADGKR